MGQPASDDDRVVFLLRVMSHFKDVLGEKAAVSLLHYAAAEAALEHWIKPGSSASQVEKGLSSIESLLGARVRIALTTPDRLVATADPGPFPLKGADEATAYAILVGVIQGMHRQSAGRFPEVNLSVPVHDDTKEETTIGT
ncbi:MAG: hypothetical protein WDA16_02400 [Candidatus Thermoplasmatota archaeon]